MEMGMEMEDDVFFADLNKQISLLLMDDDEDPNSHCSSASLQAFSRGVQYPVAQGSYSQNQTNCRRDQSKGTGVFIPQSSHPRRKNNRQSAKFSSSSSQNTTKFQYSRHSADQNCSRTRVPPPASHNFLKP